MKKFLFVIAIAITMTGCLGYNVHYRKRSKELAWWQHSTAGLSDSENPWMLYVKQDKTNNLDPWADFDLASVASITEADVSQVDSHDDVAPVKSISGIW